MGLAGVRAAVHTMKSDIVKTKFLCKTTMSTSSGLGRSWEAVFESGKIYDGEYETWSWKDGYRCNGGWRRYWVFRENGEKQEFTRAMFRSVFHDADETRNQKIDEILKKEI